MDRLSIDEAAALVGKHKRTIRRWMASGVDVSNRTELIEHNQLQNFRARGSSAILARRRSERQPALQPPCLDLQQYFGPGTDPADFVQLHAPYRQEIAERALDSLASIRDAFARRLEELKAIGHPHSIDLAEKDLQAITESYRLLQLTVEGFEEAEKASKD